MLLVAFLPLRQNAASDYVATVAPRIAELQNAWNDLKPAYRGSPFAEFPSIEGEFRPGRLQTRFLQDGLNMLNFGRMVAGLPSDVKLEPSRSVDAQKGAVTNWANGTIDHRPAHPSGMPDDFFMSGSGATGSSNLGQGYSTLAESVVGYLGDSGVDSLGHRRWCLNPSLAKTAFGFAGKSDWFSNMWVFDTSRLNADYTFFGWPSAGVFPLRFAEDGLVWSIHLNPTKYRRPDSRLRISLSRLGATPIEFGGPNRPISVGLPGYGQQICLAFRPNVKFADGQIYEVQVAGLSGSDGGPAAILFRTLISSAAAGGTR